MNQIVQFIMNHWALWLALIVIVLCIFINEFLAQKKRAKELSPNAAVELINHENATIIDLRDRESFQSGHIIDAISASVDDFQQNRMQKYKTKKLILVCARGLQSASLASKLRDQGFTAPMSLAGGIAAWQTAGLPLIKGKHSN